MSLNLFAIYPLPWSTNIVDNFKAKLVDANNKEIVLDSQDVVVGIKRMSEMLTKKSKQHLGEVSQKLFAIKDTQDNSYYVSAGRSGTLIRAKYYRAKGQAERKVRSLNRNNNPRVNEYQRDYPHRYMLVEVKLEEKT